MENLTGALVAAIWGAREGSGSKLTLGLGSTSHKTDLSAGTLTHAVIPFHSLGSAQPVDNSHGVNGVNGV